MSITLLRLHGLSSMFSMRWAALSYALVFLFLLSTAAPGQFSPRASVAVGAEYANNSNHLLLGIAQNRRLGGVDVMLSRRLLHTRVVDWNYDLAVRPLVLLQDPVSTTTETVQFAGKPPYGPFPVQDGPIQQRCTSGQVSSSNQGPNVTVVDTRVCGTRWTYAGGISPLGQRLNFGTQHRLQLFLEANAGFLASTRDVPGPISSAFNYTFEFGGGLQLFRDHRHAWALGYRYHHLSNGGIGYNNPGVDSQVLRVAYSISRQRFTGGR